MLQKSEIIFKYSKIVIFNISLLTFFVLLGCSKNDSSSGNIPSVNVNFQINTSLPQYNKLSYPNGYVEIVGEGAKGIIITNYNGQYYALERNCPYNSTQSCAVVEVQAGTINIRCGQFSGSTFTKCCESKYNFDGSILQGPTSYPLRKYTVSTSGTVISVSN